MDSQLGLIIDDLRELPGMKNRLALVHEYLLPPGDYQIRLEKEGFKMKRNNDNI